MSLRNACWIPECTRNHLNFYWSYQDVQLDAILELIEFAEWLRRCGEVKCSIVKVTTEAVAKYNCVQKRESLFLSRIKPFLEEKALELVLFWTCLISALPKIVVNMPLLISYCDVPLPICGSPTVKHGCYHYLFCFGISFTHPDLLCSFSL